MSNSVIRPLFLLMAMLLAVPGCGYFRGAGTEDADDEFPELDGDKKEDKSSDGDESSRDGYNDGDLELKLKVGERFPMQKRIEQILSQSVGQVTTINQSLLEMMLTLQVDEIRDGKRLLSVQYNRVRYGHNINGKTVNYNSETNERVPTEALVYAGLKGNGFQFWIGADNRVVELVGFSEFLQRCLRDVPPQYRDVVLRQLESTHNEEGLANFVDDGIGLLPNPHTSVKVGKDWKLIRQTDSPVPMSTNTRCVLRNLTETSAEISLVGEITGSRTPTIIPDGPRQMKVIVNGGTCNGVCTVDRRTGLPTHSEVNRTLQMTVTLPDGFEIKQKKQIQTSISAFPVQGGQMLLGAAGNQDLESNGVSPTGLGHDSGASRVTQAGGSTIGRDRRESTSAGRSDGERSRRRKSNDN